MSVADNELERVVVILTTNDGELVAGAVALIFVAPAGPRYSPPGSSRIGPTFLLID
jgi:hypothetical protein